MQILKLAIEWAKAEVFSSRFFIAFGVLFVSASIGFWQLGKTELAKSYIYPMLIAGALLLIVGIGIFYANKSRVTSFAIAYKDNSSKFIDSEIKRTEKSMGEYKTIVFKVIPVIIITAALLIIFIDKPLWRAIGITTIGMMIIILLVDSNANVRLETYHSYLLQEKRH